MKKGNKYQNAAGQQTRGLQLRPDLNIKDPFFYVLTTTSHCKKITKQTSEKTENTYTKIKNKQKEIGNRSTSSSCMHLRNLKQKLKIPSFFFSCVCLDCLFVFGVCLCVAGAATTQQAVSHTTPLFFSILHTDTPHSSAAYLHRPLCPFFPPHRITTDCQDFTRTKHLPVVASQRGRRTSPLQLSATPNAHESTSLLLRGHYSAHATDYVLLSKAAVLVLLLVLLYFPSKKDGYR